MVGAVVGAVVVGVVGGGVGAADPDPDPDPVEALPDPVSDPDPDPVEALPDPEPEIAAEPDPEPEAAEPEAAEPEPEPEPETAEPEPEPEPVWAAAKTTRTQIMQATERIILSVSTMPFLPQTVGLSVFFLPVPCSLIEKKNSPEAGWGCYLTLSLTAAAKGPKGVGWYANMHAACRGVLHPRGGRADPCLSPPR